MSISASSGIGCTKAVDGASFNWPSCSIAPILRGPFFRIVAFFRFVARRSFCPAVHVTLLVFNTAVSMHALIDAHEYHGIAIRMLLSIRWMVVSKSNGWVRSLYPHSWLLP